MRNLGNHPVVILLGIVSAVVTIFAFFSGNSSLCSAIFIQGICTSMPTPVAAVTELSAPTSTEMPNAQPISTATDMPDPITTPNTAFIPTATLTRVAQATNALLPPTPTPSCNVEGMFAALWRVYRERLGCNLTIVQQDSATIQYFQHGSLVWFKPRKVIYALYSNNTWSQHQDNWIEGQDKPFYCEEERQNTPQARMGFGKLWCTNSQVKNSLGLPTTNELPNSFAEWQEFQNGISFEVYDGDLIILFQDGTWSSYQ